MAWIKTVEYDASNGRLRQLYDRVKGPDNNVDNIMMAHSLRPHSMEGHMALYKYVLHHTANTVPKWFLETIGVWVSLLNDCTYCVEHHFSGLRRLLDDDDRANILRAAMETRDIASSGLDAAQQLAMSYAKDLTLAPGSMQQQHVIELRKAGYDDGQILEINQVTAYFNYANRTVLGLGCSTDGDILGLSPNQSDQPDNWNHS